MKNNKNRKSPMTPDECLKETCLICGNVTSQYAGNPGLWPVRLPWSEGNGYTRNYCTECVGKIVEDYHRTHIHIRPNVIRDSELPQKVKEVMDKQGYVSGFINEEGKQCYFLD